MPQPVTLLRRPGEGRGTGGAPGGPGVEHRLARSQRFAEARATLEERPPLLEEVSIHRQGAGGSGCQLVWPAAIRTYLMTKPPTSTRIATSAVIPAEARRDPPANWSTSGATRPATTAPSQNVLLYSPDRSDRRACLIPTEPLIRTVTMNRMSAIAGTTSATATTRPTAASASRRSPPPRASTSAITAPPVDAPTARN